MDEEDFLFIEETGARSQIAPTRSRTKPHATDRVFKQKRIPKPDRSRVCRLERKDMSEPNSPSQISSHTRRAKYVVSTNAGFRQWAQMETESPELPGFVAGVEDMIRVAGLPIELGTTDSKFILHHCKLSVSMSRGGIIADCA